LIVHRDIKPANILIGGGKYKVNYIENIDCWFWSWKSVWCRC
jgi:serine/threonine protein kinase